MTQGGFGLELKIMVGTVLTAIVGVEDVPFPKFKKFISESTGHDATAGYYTAVATGKRRLEPMTANIFWDADASTHAAIVTAFDSDDAVSMSIEDPDGDEVISFSAHIEAIGRISQQESTYRAQVEFHPTGQGTIA